nr:nucleotidyltransferase family protein [Desulfobacula sp.]
MDTLPGPSFSKEIEIALLCSGITIKDQDLERVKYLCTQRIDWSFLKGLIVQNRVYVIVYHNLKPFKEILPEGFLSELKELAISTGTRNFMFAVFLQRLVADFTRQGIFILPFKGPVLAEYIYKDIIFRPFSDLDVLVDKSDAVAAFDLLKNRGLTPQFKLSPSQFKKYINDEDHFSFCEPQKKITVELHWDMAGLYLSKPLTVSGLKEHITSGTLSNASIPCLSSEALLLYLCVHGAKHGWEHLEQICCVTEVLNQTRTWTGKNNKAILGLAMQEHAFSGLMPGR